MADDLLSSLKQWDRPRYLALLLMPEGKREDVLALYAFNAELERIPLLVSEPQIGEMRYQWWLDTLDAMEQGIAQDHPVAKALMTSVAKHNLPYGALRNMVEARTRLLYADRPQVIAELEGYFGDTISALIQLTAMVLDGAHAPEAATVAGLAGVALGIAEVLAEQMRFANLLPEGMTMKKFAGHGASRLFEARSKTLPPTVFLAFLTVAAAESQFHKPGHKLSPLRLQWLLWRAYRRMKF